MKSVVEAATGPMQWEHKQIVLSPVQYQAGAEHTDLHRLGLKGWELVSVVSVGEAYNCGGEPNLAYVFKRPIKEGQE